MKNDAAEAALGLLGLHADTTVFSTVPLKRSAPDDDDATMNSDSINCICGFGYDDGFSIACDDCSRWCHAACFDIVEGEVPEEWRCWVCVPRSVDREKAVKLQRERQRVIVRADAEKRKRQVSPGVDRRQHRRTSAPITDTTNAKRKRRASVNVNVLQQQQAAEDEFVNIDEPWTHSYVPISKNVIPHQETRDRLRRQAQHWRGVTALQSSPPPPSPFDTSPVQLGSLSEHPQMSLNPLSPTSFSHPVLSSNINPSVCPPSYSVHTTRPVSTSKLITPYTSTIIPSSAYLADPLNAYAHYGMPKPFVHLFGPPLDVALDSRITGNEARFVRNGCKPNAVLRPVICPSAKEAQSEKRAKEEADCDDDTLEFGVFALRDLKANEEIVLGWEWDDGNAVHCLPALLETPHLFSPQQMYHLRNQMTSMLHALSSTFTTCACGSKAKDCALLLMAAFVDGELPRSCASHSPTAEQSHGDVHLAQPKVDIGPLVGSERGFRTQEKSPLSGGMNGVEMVSPRPGVAVNVLSDRRNVDKSNAGSVQDAGRSALKPASKAESGPDFTAHASSSGTSRRGKARADPLQGSNASNRRRRRVTIDTSHRSPSPDPNDEDKMPPKMRKRWIHRSSEALRAISNSASPSGSVISLGSAISSGDGERMDIDHVFHDVGGMPPPPLPASLDPIITSPSPSPRDSNRGFTSSPEMRASQASSSTHVTPSPSTPFAKLSLLSPIASGQSDFLPADVSSVSHNLSPSSVPTFLPQTTASVTIITTPPHEDQQMLELPADESDSMKADPNSVYTNEPRGVSSSPAPPPPPHAEFEPHAEESVSSTLESCQPLRRRSREVLESEVDRVSQAVPVDSNASSTAPTSDPQTPSSGPILVTSPPSPPPAPKVKLSLKDFALRKKQQREQEMAQSSYSPAQNGDTPLISEEPPARANKDTTSPSDPASRPPTLTDVKDRQANVPDGSNLGVRNGHSPLRDVVLPELDGPGEGLVNGTSGPASVDNKQVLLNDPIADDFVKVPSPSREPSAASTRPIETPSSTEPDPSNTLDKGSDLRTEALPAAETTDPERSPSVSSRRVAEEDGEIVTSTATPQQPPSSMQSHTPPTQPRHFNSHTPSSINPSPPPLRLPSAPLRAGSMTGPSAKPLPSGPRALRAGMHSAQSSSPYGASRPFSGSQYIPRGPSADRERKEWERERGWSASRGRGRGTSSGWGR